MEKAYWHEMGYSKDWSKLFCGKVKHLKTAQDETPIIDSAQKKTEFKTLKVFITKKKIIHKEKNSRELSNIKF